MVNEFPPIVYVIREEDGDDTYLVVSENLEGFENGVVVGEYHRKGTAVLEVKRELV